MPPINQNSPNLDGLVNASKNIATQLSSIAQALNTLLPSGAYVPFQQADTAASSNTLYYSTTTSKLTYKDPSGTTHVLY